MMGLWPIPHISFLFQAVLFRDTIGLMTLQELVLERLKHLSPGDQTRVWEFVSSLPRAVRDLQNPMGLLANKGYQLDKETIDEARREEWSKFPRDFPEENE
jgi:hypothetical protein